MENLNNMVNNNNNEGENTEMNNNNDKFRYNGLNISDLPDKEEEDIEIKKTTRTLLASRVITDELLNNIFSPLNITEENGLIETIEYDNDTVLMKWDTACLSTEEDIELNTNHTIYKNNIIECLLYGRKEAGLLNGVKDYNDKSFPVFGEDSSLIASSFEIVTNYNKQDLEAAYKLIQDTLKWTTEECNNNIFISKRPQDTSNINMLHASLLVTNRSPEEMAKLGTAYKTMAFGKKANRIIDKANVSIYNSSKMIGDSILKPSAEIIGMTAGSLTGAMAQSIGVGFSEFGNEFLNSFNINAIKNRASTIELKNKIFKNRKNTSRGGVL